MRCARGFAPVRRSADAPTLIARRAAVFGPALAPLTYDRPLHVVRGEGVWLIDADGDRFLDCYNNVPVVGHCHPRVSDAIARQSRLLNTNMRYLHGAAIELAERLVASMPADSGLDTVLFVNSGSEANDTAWRLATVWTGARGGLASAFAYHGVTQAIADVSPEEWVGDDRPAHVESFDPFDRVSGRHGSRDGGGGSAARDGATPGTRHPARGHLRRRRASRPTGSSRCRPPTCGRSRI